MMNIHQLLKIFLIHIVLMIFIELIKSYFNVASPISSLTKYISKPWELFFLVVIFAPIVEEFIFRYPLVRERYVYLSLVLFILDAVISQVSLYILLLTIAISIYSFVLYFFYRKKKLPPYVILVYIILFVVFHISNYNIDEIKQLSLLSTFLLFVPQLVLGIILTYIRMYEKYSTVVIYHASYNLIFLSLALFSST